MPEVVPITSFDELVRAIRQAFDRDVVDVEYVKNLMAAYKSEPTDWMNLVNFESNRYTRNLVDKGNGKYNLMLVCWDKGPNISSMIHDHSNSHCFMKILSGNIDEIRYEWPENGREVGNSEMKVLEDTVLETDSVAYINDSLGLHRMANNSPHATAVSLHIYIPPYEKCQTFDPKTSHCKEAQVVFDSIRMPQNC